MNILKIMIVGFTLVLSPLATSFACEIICGKYALSTTPKGGIAIRKDNENFALSNYPINITYKNISDSTTTCYEESYSNIRQITDKCFIGTAKIELPDGTTINIEDNYSNNNSESIYMVRNVAMDNVSQTSIGNGYRTSFSLSMPVNDKAQVEYFIPSIIYRDTTYMRRGSIATSLDSDGMFVKESRSGLPIVMLRDADNGNTLGLMHLHPEISVGDCPGGGIPGEINSQLNYGSLGYVCRSESASLVYNYPSIESPISYEPGASRYSIKNERFHMVEPTSRQNYCLVITPGKYSNYNEAMQDFYVRSYELESPKIRKFNMDSVYVQNIELLNAEYRSMGTGKIKAAGLPWSLDLPDGKNSEGISFQMGFVGQQIAVGYHIYRYGFENSDTTMMRKGESIINFWTSDIISNSYFPPVWWDPADNDSGGRQRDYPSFLRCMTDGMESLLDACEFVAKNGSPNPAWEEALYTTVSHLVDKQNPDGSFFRAYRTDGDVEIGGDRNTQGTSKMNSHIPVRLLARMYMHTSEKKFYSAAVAAANYSYNNFYSAMGKYVGGTPDNPNTVDKEAAIYALYCFNAAHDLTGDPKYLKASEHAAINAMSWTYCYDFAVPNRDVEDIRKNPFSEGGVIGFSIIATGHSGADNFMAYVCHEMYRLYQKTNKNVYRHMSVFLQHNTKLCTDYNGKIGYKYRAFLPEATNVADFAFRSVSLWLPWSSIANIDPLVHLKDEFGTMEIEKIR